MAKINSNREIEIIGVPCDLGGGTIRGACMGPTALRMKNLKSKLESLGLKVHDRGNVAVPSRENFSCQEDFILGVRELCLKLISMTHQALNAQKLPLILGGDHSIAIGSVSGSALYLQEKNERLGLLWIDAHGDINTPKSSPTGHIHGMPLSILLGHGYEKLVKLGSIYKRVLPKNVALIGIRNIDEQEKEIIKNSGINYFTMADIDRFGIDEICKKAISAVSEKTSGIHLSCDLDALDPLEAPGVSVPEIGGLSFREARYLMEQAFLTNKIISMDFVEMNPTLDIKGQTAHLCVELILSALGKKII